MKTVIGIGLRAGYRSSRSSLASPDVINNVPGIFEGIEEIGMAKLVGLY